jgi:hypothetical protein
VKYETVVLDSFSSASHLNLGEVVASREGLRVVLREATTPTSADLHDCLSVSGWDDWAKVLYGSADEPTAWSHVDIPDRRYLSNR